MLPPIRSFSCLCVMGFALLASVDSHPGFAQQQEAHPVPPPADPLTVMIHTEDAERFARLFTATEGKPTAEQIQKDYLDNASYGVTVFTPYRIVNATHLAAAIAADQESYAHAIQQCLPRLREYDSDLRAIYLAMHGLYPDKPLPQIYVIFGAGNSGGTAQPDAQVLGLEVLCKTSDTPEALRTTMRRFFAHETVHTLQNDPADQRKSPLLAQVLTEGGADFIASLVTGETPEPQRANWAAQRESFLWSEFQKDMVATQPPMNRQDPSGAKQANLRWIGNYQKAPAGWPFEVGYWVGMRIWQCYFQAAADKHQAIRDVIDWNDPQSILTKSGYQGGSCGTGFRDSTQKPTSSTGPA